MAGITSNSTSPINNVEKCSICNKEKTKRGSVIDWVSCESCTKWFHMTCLKWSAATKTASRTGKNDFFCDTCKKNPLLENKINSALIDKIELMLSKQTADITKAVDGLRESLSQRMTDIEQKAVIQEADIITIKAKIDPFDFNQISANIEELEDKIANLPVQILSQIDHTRPTIKTEASWTIKNSITIQHIPEKEREDPYEIVKSVCSALGVAITYSDLFECYRAKPKGPRARVGAATIVATFTSAKVKKMVWDRYHAHRNLTLSNVFPDLNINTRVFINQMLPRDQYALKNDIFRILIIPKKAAKCFVKSGEMHVCKTITGNSTIVRNREDVEKLADEWTGPNETD